MDYIQGTILTKVSWKEYMIPANNPRITRFLRSKGNKVYKKILEDIENALDKDINEIMMMVHKNSIHLVSIKKDEFEEVLDYTLNWFLTREDYEQCVIARDLKDRIKDMKEYKY